MLPEFVHNRIVIGMILSLSVAHLLKGIVKLIEHPKKIKPYWVQLVWVAYVFLILIDFWWWEFQFKGVPEWNFGLYAFLIFYICIYFLICTMLFPENTSEYSGMKDYYYSRSTWLFTLLSLTFVIDIFDTLLKGKEHFTSLGIEYPIRSSIEFVLCLLAIKIKKEWYHAALGIALILYTLSWIARKSFLE